MGLLILAGIFYNYCYLASLMKKTFLYVISVLLLSIYAGKAQNMEGPGFKVRDQSALGASNGSLYYYNFAVFKKGYKVTVYKYNMETLAETGKEELIIPPVEGFTGWNPQTVTAKIINDKFYFFYTVYGKDLKLPVYMTTCNSDLTNLKHVETGMLVQNAGWSTVNFSVNFSPDNKTALIVIKNCCDKMKLKLTSLTTATYGVNSVCEDVTLVYLDLVNNTVKATKTLPVEMNGFRLRTRLHQIDNNDNVSFIASIVKEKMDDNNTIEATSTATLLKADKNVNISELNLGDTKKISSHLLQLKDGGTVYLGMLDTKIIFRLIPSGAKQKDLETTIPRKKLTATPNSAAFYELTESDAGYYVCLYHGYSNYSVAFINKQGELLWHKTLPAIQKVFESSTTTEPGPYVFSSNSKLYFMFLENKPYEENKKVLKALRDSTYISEYDFKKLNTTLITMDESGKAIKQIVNDNEITFARPDKDIIRDKDYLYQDLICFSPI